MRVSTPRRPFAFAALASLLVLSLSCGGDSGDPSPTPTEVLVTPGADTLLSVGETQAFVAVVLDANGDPIDDAEIVWSSTVPGVVSVDPVTGLATAITNGSAQVRAISGSLEGTAPVTVAQVPATVTVSPSTGSFTFAGDTLTFTATVLDAGGSPVAPVQKVWTINDNTVAVIDSNGHARAKGAGIAMVTVVAIGPGGAKAGYAAVQSTQPVASLHIRSQPTNVVAGEALDPAVQVEVRDSGGAVIAGYAGPITIGIDSGPASPVLRGTRTVNAINGVASYSGLTLERTGTHRLSATAASAAPVTSVPFSVAPAAPFKVEITDQPAQGSGVVVAGAPIGFVAELRDRFDNDSPDSTVLVGVEYVAGPAGGALYGSVTGLHQPGGNILFPEAELQKAGLGNVLRVVSVGLLPDTAAPFELIPGAQARLHLVSDSGMRVSAFVGGQPAVRIELHDEFGNLVPAGFAEVTFSATSWPYSAPPGKGQGVTDSFTFPVVQVDSIEAQAYLRPGPTALVVSAFGFIPDTGEVRTIRFGTIGQLVAGGDQTCIRGVRYCAGANGHGELGVDPLVLAEDSIFVIVDSTFPDVGPYDFGDAFLCGRDFLSAAIAPTVVCRGANDEGQLGLGSTGPDQARLTYVPGATGWWTVATGAAHACALAADSTAVCWGRNDHGQLGRGTVSANEPTPAAVLGGTKFKAIAAGGDHTCGITLASAIHCWGSNSFGELGDSTTTERTSPVPIASALLWGEIAVGADFTCAIRAAVGVKVYCWGNNSVGQLGDAAAGAMRIYPALVTGLVNDLTSILTLGDRHGCARANSGMICWGDDSRGQIGNGPGGGPVQTATVITTPEGRSPIRMETGRLHTCVLGFIPATGSEKVFCWGANDRGQLADGTTIDRHVPTASVQ